MNKTIRSFLSLTLILSAAPRAYARSAVAPAGTRAPLGQMPLNPLVNLASTPGAAPRTVLPAADVAPTGSLAETLRGVPSFAVRSAEAVSAVPANEAPAAQAANPLVRSAQAKVQDIGEQAPNLARFEAGNVADAHRESNRVFEFASSVPSARSDVLAAAFVHAPSLRLEHAPAAAPARPDAAAVPGPGWTQRASGTLARWGAPLLGILLTAAPALAGKKRKP